MGDYKKQARKRGHDLVKNKTDWGSKTKEYKQTWALDTTQDDSYASETGNANETKEKENFVKGKLKAMMGLRKDDATDADKPRDQDEADLRGSIGSQDGEMKLKIHKDKLSFEKKDVEYRIRKTRKTFDEAKLDVDSEQLDFSKKKSEAGYRSMKKSEMEPLYWPLSEDNDLGVIKVKEDQHIYMKRVEEFDDATDNNKKKIRYKMVRKKADGTEKELGEFSQEEGTASSQIVIDGNTKYHNTSGGWGFEGTTNIVDDAKKKYTNTTDKGDAKTWVKSKLDLQKTDTWDKLEDRDNFEDLKEETEDTLDVKKTKKRRRRAYRKGLLQEYAKDTGVAGDKLMEKESIFQEMYAKIPLKNEMKIQKVFDNETDAISNKLTFATKDDVKNMKEAEHYFPLADVGNSACIQIDTDKIVMQVVDTNDDTKETTYKFVKKDNSDTELLSKEFVAKDDETKVVRFDGINFMLGGVTIIGDDIEVTLEGIDNQNVDLTGMTTDIHVKSSNPNVHVIINSNTQINISSHNYPETALVSVLDSQGTIKLISVEVSAPTVTPPTLTVTSELSIADMNAVSLGSWPVDSDTALVDIKGFPVGTVVGSAVSTSTGEVFTFNKTQFESLVINTVDGTQSFSIQMRARE